VVAIEWAERLPRRLEGSVTVTIDDLGNHSRRITIEKGPGSRAFFYSDL
jgi:tRNA A37 threonylcarbamoyladenosine biosynthesis protein TsaE